MPTARVQLHLKQGRRGWTETFYLTGANANPDLNLAAADKLGVARAGLLPTYDILFGQEDALTWINRITIANTAARGQAATFSYNHSSFQSNKLNPKNGSGQRAAMYTVYSAGKTHRRIGTLRGLPVAWTSFDLDDPKSVRQSAVLRKAMDAFMAQLVNGPGGGMRWAIRYRTFANAPGGEVVTAISVENDGTWTLKVPNSTLAVGNVIKVSGLRGPSTRGINGITWVVARTGDQVTIAKRAIDDCGLRLTNFGRVQLRGDVAYEPISEAFMSGWTDRQTGRDAGGAAPGRDKPCCP